MLPVVNSISVYSFATPLVNTATPGTAITHVPYDNVAPSVSSAQVDNNASGNNNVQVAAEQPAPDNTPVEENIAASFNNSPQALSAQATFLAQLISQDTSPETAGILVQYEKLVAFSYVKYKPSNAMKPSPGPSGVFGRLLQQEKTTTVAPPAAPPPPAPVAVEPAPVVTATVREAPAPVAAPPPPVTVSLDVQQAPPPANDNPTAGATQLPPGFSAYAATISQNAPVITKVAELA